MPDRFLRWIRVRFKLCSFIPKKSAEQPMQILIVEDDTFQSAHFYDILSKEKYLVDVEEDSLNGYSPKETRNVTASKNTINANEVNSLTFSVL